MASTLDTTRVAEHMAEALPIHDPADESSDLASSHELFALLIHSYLVALDFRLLGFDEEKTLPECESLRPRLPPQWNSRPSSIVFVYAHKQSSMRFTFRIDRMGAKIEVRGLAVGAEEIRRFERKIAEVVDNSKLPIRIEMNNGQEDRSSLPQKLLDAFKSQELVEEVLKDLRVKIVQKLIPKLQKEGYVETEDAEAQARDERRQQEAQGEGRPFPRQPNPNMPYPRPDLLPEAARPRPAPVGDFPPPGFDDEYDMNRPPRDLRMPGGRSPFNIGHDDLNPPGLGPHDPLRGSFTGGGLPRPGGGSGMHPTFDDPLFGGHGGQGGGQGYHPHAPPGARWDPTGPGGNPRFPGPGSGGFGSQGSGFGDGFGGGGIL